MICPLDLQIGATPTRIVIPAETTAGAFVISGSAAVGGQEDRDALKVVIPDAAEEENEPTNTLPLTGEPPSSRTPNNYAAYLSETPTTASVLLAALDGVSTLLIWDGAKWLRYGIAGGMVVPGSTNASIERGTILWLVG